MTGTADRCGNNACTCDGYDRVRGNVALARLGRVLVERLDGTRPDHELLEQLAAAAESLLTDAIIRERLP